MNKTEVLYAHRLNMLRAAGEIVTWVFEPQPPFQLAYRCTYTPDFLIVRLHGMSEVHEVKGGLIRDDAIVKLKVAANMFRDIPFFLCQYKRDRKTKLMTWTIKRVKTCSETTGDQNGRERK